MEYITGMDTRIGFPNEHLAGDTQKSDASPILATAVGLLLNALEDQTIDETGEETTAESLIDEENQNQSTEGAGASIPISSRRKTILDRWVEKFKEFLDNA